MPTFVETYDQAMEFLSRRINYERTAMDRRAARAIKLERMRALLSLLENPHEQCPAVHVAGTKGKGSTAVMIAEMLAAAGYRVGLFTSPHVATFAERMAVNGARATQRQIVALVNRVAPEVERLDREDEWNAPTYFEIATTMAWLFFREQKTEIDVLEVGLGGRLDSTNVCRPELTVITNISLDHTQVLGESLREIAREKAGIIKPGIPVVSGVQEADAREEILAVAARHSAAVRQLGDDIRYTYHRAVRTNGSTVPASVDVENPFKKHLAIPLTLAGEHQAANAALAVTAIDWLNSNGRPISEDAVRRGMNAVRWPIRLEVLQQRPQVLVDAAHNPASARALAAAVREEFPADRRILLFAVSRDKDALRIAGELFPLFDEVVLTAFIGNPRAVPADELFAVTHRLASRSPHIASDPAEAWMKARELAGSNDLILATGSFYLAAEMREIVLSSETGVSANGVSPVANAHGSPNLLCEQRRT